MAYQVLARKWRPQRFEDVLGQEHVTTTLKNAIARGRIAHAFLFSGPRGVGKTTVARLLAKALNCAKGPTPDPCGTCASCVEIAAGNALDVAEIDGASNTSVDNIRDLNENVRYRPAAARFKIYIIDEVHMLSTAAFNALLKTLEEPPEHVKFVFATTEVQKLPQTVISRCQRYEFKRIALAALLARLRQIIADEGVEVSDGALFDLAREADGSMRDAQSLLDQVIVFAGKTIAESDVHAALGVADRSVLHRVTEAILRRDPAPCLVAIDELYRYGYDVPRFCRDLVQQIRNLTVAALFRDRALLTDLPDNEVEETLRQAELRSAEDLQRLFRLAQTGAEEVRKSVLPKLVLEMTLVKMATMPDAAPVDELVARLAEMERRLEGPGGGSSGGREDERGPSPAERIPRTGAPPTRGASAAAGETAPASVGPNAPSPSSPTPAAIASPHGTSPGTARVANGGGTSGPVGAQSGWERFLAAAAEAQVGLKLYLINSRIVEESAERLHIQVESEWAQRNLQQRETLRLLGELAARSYGGARQIDVSVAKPAVDDPATRKVTEAAHARELEERARTSPAVRAAIEILGGEVTDVRPRSRGGKS